MANSSKPLKKTTVFVLFILVKLSQFARPFQTEDFFFLLLLSKVGVKREFARGCHGYTDFSLKKKKNFLPWAVAVFLL